MQTRSQDTAEEGNLAPPQAKTDFDFSDVGAEGPDPYEVDLSASDIPPGNYLAVLDDLSVLTSFNGYPYYDTWFTVLAPEEYQGRRVGTTISFHPNSLRWTLQRLEAIAGHALPRERVNVEDEAFQKQFLHRRVRLTIGTRKGYFSGQPEPDVKAIYPVEEQ